MVRIYSNYEVDCGDCTFCLRFIPICVKGDWPFLRKAGHLVTGFTSKRVCHLCNSEATGLVCRHL